MIRIAKTPIAILAIVTTGIAVADRKSTRLNSSHGYISYAVFCLKKKSIGVLSTARSATPTCQAVNIHTVAGNIQNYKQVLYSVDGGPASDAPHYDPRILGVGLHG